jgi:hypothetical protein
LPSRSSAKSSTSGEAEPSIKSQMIDAAKKLNVMPLPP